MNSFPSDLKVKQIFSKCMTNRTCDIHYVDPTLSVHKFQAFSLDKYFSCVVSERKIDITALLLETEEKKRRELLAVIYYLQGPCVIYIVPDTMMRETAVTCVLTYRY